MLALCISHIDYANAILFGVPDVTIGKMQHVQNMCAKLVLSIGKYKSNSHAVRRLHWLPIKSRIVLKIITVVHRCIHGNEPKYLENLLILNNNVLLPLPGSAQYNNLALSSGIL